MNTQMLLFKALAIIDVVLRHKYWPFTSFLFIASSIPLFLFLSGYFYKSDGEKNPLRFIVKKFKRLMILYFVYNAIYAGITYFIYVKKGELLGSLPNWYNFFIQPFIDGQQYTLINPMWFIPFFFMVQIIYMFISRVVRRFTHDELTHFVVFVFIGLGAYGLRDYSDPAKYVGICILLKFMVGLFYISLGRIFALKLATLNIYQIKFLILAMAIRASLFTEFTSPVYNYAAADFHELSGLVYTVIDIYFLLYLSRFLSRFPLIDRVLCKIGSNTYHIMANHMMVFMVVDMAVIGIRGTDPDNPYNDLLQRIWWIYAIAGVGIPTCIGIVSKYCKKRFIAQWNEVGLPLWTRFTSKTPGV